jgi:alkylation response protein AidB-like acyl-CoA dehydrogenase
MGYQELDIELSREVKAMQKEIRKFAMEEVRPAGIELDKLQDPADVYAENSVLWDVHKKFREMNLHQLGIPKELGGMGNDIDPKGKAVLAEELGYGDAGLAISLGVSSNPYRFAALSKDPEVQQLAKDFCQDTSAEMIGCWAITEPAHGSDYIMAMDPEFDDSRCGPDLTAELKGDEFILNGQKSAWVSNGTIATHATVHVGLTSSNGMHGAGLAIVPLNLPGISKGTPLDKIGQRALNQGEIFFEEVKLPKKYMIVPDSRMMIGYAKAILTGANTGMGTIFTGLAQAAYDEALKYAKQRIQGGQAIFEHKNIKLQLFNMFRKVETARALARRVSLYNAINQPGAAHYAVASKVTSTQTAFEVASEAITIFGGNGLAREYIIEKLFRDARASMIEDGENNALSIAASHELK